MYSPCGTDRLRVGTLPLDTIPVPECIELERSQGGTYYLHWTDHRDSGWTRVSSPGALDEFVRIRTPQDALLFARSYGTLHRIDAMLCPEGGVSGREPIAEWISKKDKVVQCLNVMATLRNTDPNSKKQRLTRRYLQAVTMLDINEWLRDAGVRMELNWSGDNPILVMKCDSILGVLGVQLLAVVTHTSLTICSGCGLPYLREKRLPQAGKRNFCPSCGDRIAARLRQRDKRKREAIK